MDIAWAQALLQSCFSAVVYSKCAVRLTDTRMSSQPPNRVQSGRSVATTFLVTLLCVAVLGLLLVRRAQGRRGSCISQLKMIDGAVYAISLEESYPTGYVIPRARIAEVMKEGRFPACPSGGQYIVAPVGGRPSCTVHGDLLR